MNISSISSIACQVNATTASARSQPKPPTQDQKALIQAVKAVNTAEMFGQENEVTFKIDRTAGIAVVRVVNKKTGALVQEIPSEQILKMAEESNGG
ncbi:MAG TPA: flagellar protein FlaG [Bryobacteraceae bacterium]|nr:flagellar protein FlaG [Bryobacteraceae bacterium]